MAESKNIFIKSKMNKDLDDRLLQQGEYRNAVNIQVSKSESEDVGALENILGNIKSIDTGSGHAIVGYLVSEKNSSVYLFTTNNKIVGNPNGDYSKNSTCQIVEYIWNGSSFSTTNLLVSGAFLNFWEGSPIVANLLEDFLFFTDNRNQPRKINILLARESSTHYQTEDDISIAKYTPYVAPLLYQTSPLSPGDYETTMKDVVSEYLPDGTTDNPYYNALYQGDPDYLEDKFVRFGYRFQYEDNEYSVFSPFTQECFIPKQDGYFLEGDEQQTVASTVVSFLENKVNQITLRIPMPSVSDPALPSTTLANVTNQFKIKNVEILYKESDEIRVLVVDTLRAQDIINQYLPFYISNPGTSGYTQATDVPTTGGTGTGLIVTVSRVDSGQVAEVQITDNGSGYVEGDVVTIDAGSADATITIKNLNTLEYTYSGTKPFKTLPEAQTVRVYDKVPVKAKTQEIISNRVVYGNFQTKHTPPSDLNYNVGAQQKLTFDLGTYGVDAATSIVEYPNHSLKQNRNYQAGFVFADRFGRATSTVLSNSGSISSTTASQLSTVYSPYNDSTVDIPAWPGDSLVVQLNDTIPLSPNPSSLYPGVYNGDPNSDDYNPLGFYSWKIVVKQQEQDYYTVYLPSAMKGNPYFTGTPSATEPPEQNASFVTIINDNINKIPRDLTEVGPQDKSFRSSVILYGRVENTESTFSNIGNVQYYPERRSFTTNVIEDLFDIFDVADFNATGQAPPITNDNNPYFAFFRSESNPFIAEFITSQTELDQFGITNEAYTNGTAYDKFENLTIVETNPVESRLDIYWETSTSGTIADLNEYVSNEGGSTIFALENFNFEFNEDFEVYTGTVLDPEPSNGRAVVNNNGPFYFSDVFNQPITQVSLISFSVTANNTPVNGQFDCIKVPANDTVVINGVSYNNPYDSFYIVSTNRLYYDNNNLLAQDYTFSITVQDTFGAPNINVTKTVANNLLGNKDTEIVSETPSSPVDYVYGYTQPSNGLAQFIGTNGGGGKFSNNGATSLNQNGLSFQITEVRDGGGNVVQTGNTGLFTMNNVTVGQANEGQIVETVYGAVTGSHSIDVLLTGPEATNDTTTYELTIGEETADGSFTSTGSPVTIFSDSGSREWSYGGTYIGSFHDSNYQFGDNIQNTFYPTTLYWNNTQYNLGACFTSGSQSGTPTGAQQWYTSPRVTTDSSAGYGFTMGTGIIYGYFEINGQMSFSSFYNYVGTTIAQISVDYRPNSTSSWVAAKDIEGRTISMFNSNSVSNTNFQADKNNAGNSYNPFRQRYGARDGSRTINSGSKGATQFASSISDINNSNQCIVPFCFVIGNSPVYNGTLGNNYGTGHGEYRVVVGYNNGSFTQCSNSGISNNGAQSLSNLVVRAADFYYDFGSNRSYAYKINTTAFSTRQNAIDDASNTSPGGLNTNVYAREPFARYVSQFYTDPGLTNPLDLGNGTPAYFAYMAAHIPATGSDLVANASTNASVDITIAMESAQLPQGFGGSTAPPPGHSGTVSQIDRQTDRMWTARFTRNTSEPNGLISYKVANSAEPKGQ